MLCGIAKYKIYVYGETRKGAFRKENDIKRFDLFGNYGRCL